MSGNTNITVNIADTVLIGLTAIIYLAGVAAMSTSSVYANTYMGILCLYLGIIMAIMGIYILLEDSVPESAKYTKFIAFGTAIATGIIMFILGAYTLSSVKLDGLFVRPGSPFTIIAIVAFLVMTVATLLINNMLICYKANSKRNYWAASLLNYCAMISVVILMFIAFINYYGITTSTVDVFALQKQEGVRGPESVSIPQTNA